MGKKNKSKAKKEKKDKKLKNKKVSEKARETIMDEKMKEENTMQEAAAEPVDMAETVVEPVPTDAQEQIPASSEAYKALEEKIASLELAAASMKKEIGRLKNRTDLVHRHYFKEFLESPVLADLVSVYIENEDKAELYDEIVAYLRKNPQISDKIEVELTADRVRYSETNLTSLSAASGILSVAGIVYAAAGAGTQMGVLIVLFLVLAILSSGVWMQSVKHRECSRMIEYILASIGKLEKVGKSKIL